MNTQGDNQALKTWWSISQMVVVTGFTLSVIWYFQRHVNISNYSNLEYLMQNLHIKAHLDLEWSRKLTLSITKPGPFSSIFGWWLPHEDHDPTRSSRNKDQNGQKVLLLKQTMFLTHCNEIWETVKFDSVFSTYSQYTLPSWIRLQCYFLGVELQKYKWPQLLVGELSHGNLGQSVFPFP